MASSSQTTKNISAKKEASPARAPKKKEALSLEAPVYTMAGKPSGKITLPESVFGAPWKADLVHQVVTAMRANARPTTAHTKTRGEVRGGGKKPWKQKGTGRARHGSTRSPIWRGGGTTHGPRAERSYEQKINRKMRSAALAAVLSRKFKEGGVLFIDTLSFEKPQTKKAREMLDSLARAAAAKDLNARKKNTALIALAEKNLATEKSFSNFGNLFTEETRNLNPVDILRYRYLLIENPSVSLRTLSTRIAGESSS